MAVIQFPAGRIVRPPIDLTGIEIVSRHDVEAEIDGMRAMLVEVLRAGLPDEHWIRSIGCNSKFSPCFRVVLGLVEDDYLLRYTAERFAAAACNVFGGHNGVLIEIGDGTTFYLEPEWPGSVA